MLIELISSREKKHMIRKERDITGAIHWCPNKRINFQDVHAYSSLVAIGGGLIV